MHEKDHRPASVVGWSVGVGSGGGEQHDAGERDWAKHAQYYHAAGEKGSGRAENYLSAAVARLTTVIFTDDGYCFE